MTGRASDNPRRPTGRKDVPVSIPDPLGGDPLLVISQVAYLEMMEERDPQPLTQSDWTLAWAAYKDGRTPDRPSDVMPPSWDRSLLTPGGWACDCNPLHGIILRREGVFVRRTHHEDDADGAWIVMPPIAPSHAEYAEAQAKLSARAAEGYGP